MNIEDLVGKRAKVYCERGFILGTLYHRDDGFFEYQVSLKDGERVIAQIAFGKSQVSSIFEVDNFHVICLVYYEDD